MRWFAVKRLGNINLPSHTRSVIGCGQRFRPEQPHWWVIALVIYVPCVCDILANRIGAVLPAIASVAESHAIGGELHLLWLVGLAFLIADGHLNNCGLLVRGSAREIS